MSGSFIKSTRSPDGARSFFDALVFQYGSQVGMTEVQIGGKMVEMLGFEKLQMMQRQFNELQVVSVSRCCVDRLGGEDENDWDLPMLKELDLGFNLIESFDVIVKLLQRLHLDKLSIIGNRFSHSTLQTPVRLRSLNMTMVYPSDELLDALPRIFPLLQELSLSDNRLEEYALDIPLVKLDLSMNAFTTIPELPSSLISLKINENSIKIHPYIHLKLEKLDIRHNNVSTWHEIQLLAANFPFLTELRINGNPLSIGYQLEEFEFEIIARIPGLQRLNGVDIHKDRKNAEMWWVSGQRDDVDVHRWDELVKKFGRTVDDAIRSPFVDLIVHHGGRDAQIRVLKSQEVLRVRSLIGRVFGVQRFTLGYYINGCVEKCNDVSLLSNYDTNELYINL